MINHLTNIQLYIPSYPEQLIEKKILFYKILEVLRESEWRAQNMQDSQSPPNSQIQDSYSIFQVPPQQEKEPINLEDRIEALI